MEKTEEAAKVLSIGEAADAALAIECQINVLDECGKFNRYKPYKCTCGAESRRMDALEALAERIQKAPQFIRDYISQ